jgi:hypothetical protein
MPTSAYTPHGSLTDGNRRSYITTSTFENDFYRYVLTQNPTTFVTTGALSAALNSSGVAVTAANCPAGRILRENGKRLFPGAHNGISTLMVGVYDASSFLNGFIDPNSPKFAIYNTDKPNFFADGINPNGGATDKGAPIFTAGTVTADSGITTAGPIAQIRSVSNITDGASMAMSADNVVNSRIVTATLTTARDVQLPTAASIITLLGTTVGTTVEFTYINLAATNVATFTINTGTSIIGAATTAGSTSSRWLIRVASGTTVVVYRT